MATANLPVPLFPLLQERDGFGPLMVAVIFAAYAAGVIASLVLLGGVSDRFGRRRVLVPALALSALGTTLLAACEGTAGLIAGRFLVGLATGVVPAAATAFLVDLGERTRPAPGPRRGQAAASAAKGAEKGAEAVATDAKGPRRTGAVATDAKGPRRTGAVATDAKGPRRTGAVATAVNDPRGAEAAVTAKGPRRGTEAVATAANLGGLGGGPLVAGLLATGPGDPLVVPFAVFAALTALGAVALTTTRETVAVSVGSRRALEPIRVRAAGAAVRAAWAALFAAYAVQAFFSSLAPGLLADTMDEPSPVVAGAVACVLYVTAAVSQLALGDRPRHALLRIGVALLPAGVAIVTAGVWQAELALVLAGGALAGTGIGALTRGCIATVTELTPPSIRGEALSGLFLAGYVGLCLPVLGLGLASEAFDPTAALAGFSALVMAAIAAAGRLLLRANA